MLQLNYWRAQLMDGPP